MVGRRDTDTLAGGVKKASAMAFHPCAIFSKTHAWVQRQRTPRVQPEPQTTQTSPTYSYSDVRAHALQRRRASNAHAKRTPCHLRRRHDIRCIDCDVNDRSRRYRPSMLVMVATSLIEYALDSRWTRGSQTDVLWTPSAPSNHTSPCYLAAATRSPFALWYCCTDSHENDATIACVTYLHKYVSKSHGIVTCRRSAKWHAQARMLSRALPVDVVIMIGDHVRELAAIVLQKFMRGAAVRRLAWGLPGLCDADGNLVYL